MSNLVICIRRTRRLSIHDNVFNAKYFVLFQRISAFATEKKTQNTKKKKLLSWNLSCQSKHRVEEINSFGPQLRRIGETKCQLLGHCRRLCQFENKINLLMNSFFQWFFASKSNGIPIELDAWHQTVFRLLFYSFRFPFFLLPFSFLITFSKTNVAAAQKNKKKEKKRNETKTKSNQFVSNRVYGFL